MSLAGCGYRTCSYTCGIDRPYGDYKRFTSASFDACSKACAEDTRCQVAAFDKSSNVCWLKDSVTSTYSNSQVDLIECGVRPSAVWSTILASSTPFVQSACACLQSQGTSTVTITPSSISTVTATATSTVTAVETR